MTNPACQKREGIDYIKIEENKFYLTADGRIYWCIEVKPNEYEDYNHCCFFDVTSSLTEQKPHIHSISWFVDVQSEGWQKITPTKEMLTLLFEDLHGSVFELMQKAVGQLNERLKEN